MYPELTAGIRARARQERKLREYFNTSAPLVHAARMEVDTCTRSGDTAALNRALARFATLAARLQAESAELTWGSRDGLAWQMLPTTSSLRTVSRTLSQIASHGDSMASNLARDRHISAATSSNASLSCPSATELNGNL